MEDIHELERLTISFNENDFIAMDKDKVFEINPKMTYPIGCPYSLQDIMDGAMCETEDYIDK